MSTRSKRLSKTDDSGKKPSKEEENTVENMGRRRSLRNSTGSSLVAASICRKPRNNSSTSKQMKKISDSIVEDNIGKNEKLRITKNLSKNRGTSISILNSKHKMPTASLKKNSIKNSPRNDSNGNIELNVRRYPKRKSNSRNNPVINSELDSTCLTKKLTRSSKRKRPFSPDKQTSLPQSSNAPEMHPSKKKCRSVQSNENSRYANGEVSKSKDSKKVIVADASKPMSELCHPQKLSGKRALHLDPEDISINTPNKRIKCDFKSGATLDNNYSVKNTEESVSEKTEKSIVKTKNKSPSKCIELSKIKLIKEPQSIEVCNINEMNMPVPKKSPRKSTENFGKLVDSEVVNYNIMESSPPLAVICIENEEIFSTASNIGSLFDECKLNEDQKRELFSILPKNCAGRIREELVEVLVKLLLETGTTVQSMTSPRFNKFLRNLLNIYCNSKCSIENKHKLCENVLNWAKEKQIVNLTHELQLALMNLYYDTQFYKKAECTATILYNETKKLQDKEKIVQACLCLSQTYHAMGNISKARANITTAKTEALKIYIVPDLQAELDLQSGIMQIAEEKDMETAFSYFKEAATSFTVCEKRSRALKYMLLSKLLVNRPEEGEKLVQMQIHILDIDDGVEALIAVTKAAISCSLENFKSSLDKYNKELREDLVLKDVIDKLYCKLLEKNLINIIKPYDKLQISYVANKIGLHRDEVERRLSQLILDGQIKAQLDHRDDCLYVYESEAADKVYPKALDTISQLDKTVTHLNKRVKQLL